MIICKECGHQNEDDDLFCGNCPAFLEYSGERIGGPEPTVEEAAPASQPGLVTRIRHAISGTDLPPPSGAGAAAGAGLGPPVPGASTSAPAGAPIGGLPAPPRTGDERAAALVAKPDTLQPPDGKQTVTARAPEAQRPQTPLPRPKVAKQAPSRKINPGDLVCGVCGEGNDPQRNYCRRCGSTLAEAVVSKTRWFRRRPKRKKSLAAGDRPGRPGSGTSGRNAARGARIARGKFLGRLADVKRILALLAIVGIGVGLAVPNLRTWVTDNAVDAFNKVKRTVSPEYTNIAIDRARVTSPSGGIAGGEATNVADSNTLTYWLAPPEAANPSVVVGFVEPTNVEHVLVHPGQQEDGGKVVRPDPRPRELLFRLTAADGTITEVAATLEDTDGFQKVKLETDDVASVETVVVNCFPDPVVTVCPITELEFQKKK